MAEDSPGLRLKYYSAYGLALASNLDLPELVVDTAPSFPVDLLIRGVDTQIDANLTPTELLDDLEVFTVSNESFGFRVSFGRLIEVWAPDPEDLEVVRPLLLGPILTIALHQQRLWPLHVGAVQCGGQAWLISGPSGAGKSTLVTYLARALGLVAISDDAGVLFDCDQGFEFAGASRAFRLTRESYQTLFASQCEPHELLPNPIDNKIRVRLCVSGPVPRRIPVAGMVRIRDLPDSARPPAHLVKLSGFRAVEAVRAALFQPFSDHRLRTAAETLEFCAKVARRIPVYDLQRVRDLSALGDVAACLTDLFRSHEAAYRTTALEAQK